MTYLGLINGCYFLSNILWGVLYFFIVKRQKKLSLKKQDKESGPEGNGAANGHARISIIKDTEDTDRESTI